MCTERIGQRRTKSISGPVGSPIKYSQWTTNKFRFEDSKDSALDLKIDIFKKQTLRLWTVNGATDNRRAEASRQSTS